MCWVLATVFLSSFYHKVFNILCASLSLVLCDIYFFLSPLWLIFEHFLSFMPRYPALINLGSTPSCFSSIWALSFQKEAPLGVPESPVGQLLSTFPSSCSCLALKVKSLPVLPAVPRPTPEQEPLLSKLTTRCQSVSGPALRTWVSPVSGLLSFFCGS